MITFFFFSLVILGNNTEFQKAVLWLSENLRFDVDARINLFEVPKSLDIPNPQKDECGWLISRVKMLVMLRKS